MRKLFFWFVLIVSIALLVSSCTSSEDTETASTDNTTTTTTDTTAATLAEVTIVTTPTNNSTTNYTFSSDEAGIITYGGSCSSGTTSATSGNNTITLVSLSDGTYSNCTIIVTDSAGNASSALSVSTFVVDTTAPSVSSFTLSDTALITDDNATVTLRFSEAVVSFSSSADITVANGTLAAMSSADNITWTGTFTPTANTEDASNTLSLATSYTDIVGNAGPAATTANYAVETLAPSVDNFTLSDTALKAGDNATVTLRFSEAVVSFSSAADITADNGTLAAMSSADNITWTGTFTPTANTEDASNTLSLATSYTDTAGNAGPAATTANYAVETLAPSVDNFTLSDTALKAGDTATVTLRFSEAVASFASGDDITVASGSGSLANMTSADNVTWAGTFTPTADTEDASNVLSLATSYTDTAGNAGPAETTANYAIDTQAPSVSSFTSTTADGSYKSAGTVNITATASEAVVSGNTITATLDTSDNVTLTAAANGTTLVGTYTVGAGDNSNDLTASSFSIGTVTDIAGNAMSGTDVPDANIASGSAIVIDTTVPTITSFTSTTADGSYKSAGTVNITATASEAVVATNTITATLDTSDNVTLTAADNGTTLVGTYTVGAGDNSNDLTVSSFSIGTVTDIVGNAMSSTTVPGTNIASGSAIVIEATAPTITSFTSTTSNGSYKSDDTVNITATASESVVATNTITATLDTSDNVTLTAAANGKTLVGTYTVGAGDNSNDLTVSSFSIGTVTDIAGNAMASTAVPGTNIASGSAIVIDTTAPTVSSVSTTADNQSFVSITDNITVTFSEAMGPSYITADESTGCGASIQVSSDNFNTCVRMSDDPEPSNSNMTFTLDPVDNLTVGTTYLTRVTTAAKDTAGNAMSSQYDNSTGFAPSDTIAPTVSSVSTTADNQSSIAITDNITVTFSEAMDNTTVTTNTDNTSCYGTLRVSSDNFSSCVQMSSSSPESSDNITFTLDPSDNLTILKTYLTRVTTGVKDTAGNALSSQYDNSTGFTTLTPSSYQMGGSIQGTELSLSTAVTTFAGSSSGSTDATGTSASFDTPYGITTDGTNLYVADRGNHRIRKIVIDNGTVTTLAGTGSAGSTDHATGTSASFNKPSKITTDGTNLYVTDSRNHKIRKIVIDNGTVTTLAGSSEGSTDATGTSASFDKPYGITTDGTNLYVADRGNHKIRKIVIDNGTVTTLAGSSQGSTDGTGTSASFDRPYGITTDGTNLYVADHGNHRIRKIVIDNGTVTTLAGSSYGSTDGTGTSASFSYPTGITTDGTNLYVTDHGNHRIRKIVISTGVVTTLAGSSSGNTDATGTSASFNYPTGITTDGTNLYVSDQSNQWIRKIVISTGVVTTLAGSSSGSTDATGTSASFNYPNGITTDGTNLYVADQSNHRIRKIE